MKAIGFGIIAFGAALIGLFALQMWNQFGRSEPVGGRFSSAYSDAASGFPKETDDPAADEHRRLPSGLSRAPDKDQFADLDAEQFGYAVRREDYIYHIRSGDSVEALAKKFLGDPSLAARIVEANPELDAAGRLPAGTDLVIPFKYRR